MQNITFSNDILSIPQLKEPMEIWGYRGRAMSVSWSNASVMHVVQYLAVLHRTRAPQCWALSRRPGSEVFSSLLDQREKKRNKYL